MRFWTASFVMFLMVTAADAQVRSARPMSRGPEVFRGAAPGFNRFPAGRPVVRSFPRQNLIIAPPLPFYSYYPYDPYYSGLYYTQAPYSAQDQSANIAQINSLTEQVQQLTNQVQQLQDELAATRGQQVQPSSLQVTPAPPPQPVIPTVLIFQDGHRLETQGYAIVGQTLWTSGQEGFKKILLSELNLDATRKENLKRGINFLPQR